MEDWLLRFPIIPLPITTNYMKARNWRGFRNHVVRPRLTNRKEMLHIFLATSHAWRKKLVLITLDFTTDIHLAILNYLHEICRKVSSYMRVRFWWRDWKENTLSWVPKEEISRNWIGSVPYIRIACRNYIRITFSCFLVVTEKNVVTRMYLNPIILPLQTKWQEKGNDETLHWLHLNRCCVSWLNA